MKICFGYYDENGNNIGDKLDNPNRDKFFVVIAKYKKKIAEHDGQCPYTNGQILSWTKTRCDMDSLFFYIDEYTNGKITRKMKPIYYSWYYWSKNENKYLKEKLRKIINNINDHKLRIIKAKYNITDNSKLWFPIE